MRLTKTQLAWFLFVKITQTAALNPLVLDPHVLSPFLRSATAETHPSPYVLSACPSLSHYHAPRANHPSATAPKHSYTTHSREESWSLKEKKKKHVEKGEETLRKPWPKIILQTSLIHHPRHGKEIHQTELDPLAEALPPQSDKPTSHPFWPNIPTLHLTKVCHDITQRK